MKKLAALLLACSLSVFSMGCEEAGEEEPAPAGGGAVGADMDDADTPTDDPTTTE